MKKLLLIALFFITGIASGQTADIKEFGTISGSTITLLGTGFSSAYTNGAIIYCHIENLPAWEVASCTYNTGNTLTVGTIISNSLGNTNAITFSQYYNGAMVRPVTVWHSDFDLASTFPISFVTTAATMLTLPASGALLASPVDLSGANVTGTLAAARFPALTGDVTNSAGSVATTVGAIQNKTITLATGYLKYTGSAWSFDNSTFLTGNQTITLSGDVTGSGTTAITTAIGSGKVTNTMLAGSIDVTTKITGVVPFANGANQGTAATPATTGAMTVTMNTGIVTITPTGACTFNASGGLTSQITTFIITTSGASSFVLTFGTNFKSTGTLATGTTTAKIFTVTFRCTNGTQWVEIGRTIAQ